MWFPLYLVISTSSVVSRSMVSTEMVSTYMVSTDMVSINFVSCEISVSWVEYNSSTHTNSLVNAIFGSRKMSC